MLTRLRSRTMLLPSLVRSSNTHIQRALRRMGRAVEGEILPGIALFCLMGMAAIHQGAAYARLKSRSIWRSCADSAGSHVSAAMIWIGRAPGSVREVFRAQILPVATVLWSNHFARPSIALFHAVQARLGLRLRTKFLISSILITSGLTCGALLIVGRTAQDEAQRQIEEEAHNAILTFQVMQHQHEVALRHKADLLAALALMRNGDATTIQEASEDPWQSEDCNLFLLADASGKVVALHTAGDALAASTAEALLRKSLRGKKTEGWWFSGEHLYQIVLRPVFGGADQKHSRLGTVVVGRAIDDAAANELRRISSSEVAFRYGKKIIVSTLAPLDENNLQEQLGDRAVPRVLHIDHEKFLATSQDLTDGVDGEISLIVLKSYDDATTFLNRLNRLLLGLFLVAAIVGAALVFLISDTFTRPLASLVGGVQALEQGDFTYPLEADGGDEVAQVTRAFDGMRTTLQRNQAQREELEGQLRQSQKMEAMGRLAGGVAHDFNNLLTVIKGHSDLLLDRMDPSEPLRGSSQQIAKAADRAAALTRQLLIFSRKQVLQPKVIDLNAIVAEMGTLLKRLVREDIEFSFRPSDSLGRLKADPGQIEQVIMNLVVNSCDAMSNGGKLTIETYNLAVSDDFARTQNSMAPGNYVVLAVTDTGCGMNAATKAHIFEPFFTTKEAGKGTGLGLATVYGVVNQSNGYIWVDSQPGRGARFEIYLPKVEIPVETLRAEKPSSPSVQRNKVVLIAEDEEAVRELACEFLQSAGYKVISASDGVDALAIAEQTSGPIHVLVTDIVLPKMRGTELAERLKRSRPDIKIVYMSGYLEYDKKAEQFLEEGAFLQKPYTRDALISKVDEILLRHAVAEQEPELASSVH